MLDLFNLHGKSVAITGGSGYLGAAMSEALAEYGADLYILGHNPDKDYEAAERMRVKHDSKICKSIFCDIYDRGTIEKACNEIIEYSGKIDVIINNAAFYGDVTPFEDCSDEDWNRSIDGTINTLRLVTKVFIQQMLRQKSGNIINIASMYGVVAPDMSIYGNSRENNPASYGAGKAAIIQLTKYLAAVYAKDGIRVNAVSPGAFPQPDVQKNTDFIHNLEKKNPMGRIGHPDDLKGLIVFLASDSSSYINGQNILVDGGWTAW